MKLLIVAGGGGHFTPALAVIEELPKDWEILLVGRKHSFEGDTALSLEYQTAQKLHIPFKTITTGRLQRKFTKHTIASLVKTPFGLIQAFNILRSYKPDVVISFGGYIAVPVAVASSVLRIPLVLHEQTLGAGLANKLSAKFAKKICISWEESFRYFPNDKIILTGNPIRQHQAVNLKKSVSENNIPLIYITGGSAGAHGINNLVEGELVELLKKYQIIHQTGDAREFGDFERLEGLKKNLPSKLQDRYILAKFLNPSDVFPVIKRADLVVSRSGINTVTELLFHGKPNILIPLPYGQENEQLSNARLMERTGLGIVADQNELDSKKLSNLIDMMVNDLKKYKRNADYARSLIKLNAADKIIEVIKNASKNQI